MDILSIATEYVESMVTCAKGMKALLLDKETTAFVSVVFSRSRILQREVYLVEGLDTQNRAQMFHLNAIIFVRPTEENFKMIEQELLLPKFVFSNLMPESAIPPLAAADQYETVKEVKEIYFDFLALNRSLFSLAIKAPERLLHVGLDEPVETRIIDGVVAALLATQRNPCIRFRATSAACKSIATSVVERLHGHRSARTRTPTEAGALLILFDRRDDGFTPLLTPWTYQALVHELFTIQNNRVDLRGRAGISKEMQEVSLTVEQDAFYRANIFESYGVVCDRVRELASEFISTTETGQRLQTIAEMQRFVEQFPEYRKLKGNVSKHITLLNEAAAEIDRRDLMTLSEFEQELATLDDNSASFRKLEAFIRDEKVVASDALRLALLYVMKYQDKSKIDPLRLALANRGLSPDDLSLLDAQLRFCSRTVRAGVDLFPKGLLASAKTSLKRSFKGVENIYMQHEPLLLRVVKNAVKDSLSETAFPFAYGSANKPKDVIIFVVGGVSYYEAHALDAYARSSAAAEVLVGGTAMLNSAMWGLAFISAYAAIGTLTA